MILIDGNNVTRRYLHVAVAETLKDFFTKDYDGTPPSVEKLTELKTTFLHFVLWEILEMKSRYKLYGDVIIAFDSKHSWRRRVYDDYKANRRKPKSKAEAMQDNLFYWMMPYLYEILDATPYTILKDLTTPDGFGIEADDIIGILAPTEKSVICSTDEDFTQLLSDHVKQYHSYRKVLLGTPSKKDVEFWKQYNIISGQSKDGIPGIMQHCKLSEDFIKWCKDTKDLEITGEMIEKIEKDHQNLMTEYEEAKAVEDDKLLLEGKRKIRRYLTAYEKPKGGEKMVIEFMNNFDVNLKANPRWKTHYERNADLLLFDRIPQDVKDVILQSYHSQELMVFFDTVKFQSILMEQQLYKMVDRIHDF